MVNQIENLAYDIILNYANFLTIVKYRVIDSEATDKNGKKEYFRKFLYIESEVCDDIEKRISELRKQGYLYINRFRYFSFDIMATNPLVNTKLMLLEKDHKLLEKVFQEEIVNHVTYLTTYITCINMKTGKISFVKVGKFDVYSLEKVDELKKLGYKYILDSFYYAHTNLLDESRKR